MRLQPNQIYRRTNWSMTIGRTLDVSVETLADRAQRRTRRPRRRGVRPGAASARRGPAPDPAAESGAICFLIRTYLLPLADVAGVDEWRVRMAAVLAELPEEIAGYKGISGYRDRVVSWLRSRG